MKITNTLALLLALAFVPSAAFADDLTADAIVDKALDFNSMGFQSGQAQVSLEIANKSDETKTRKLELKSKKIDGKTRTLVTLTGPKELRGQAFLFAERAEEDDVWMYLPAFKVVRRIEGGQKDGAFLGSHFTYADLESQGTRNASYKRLDDEKIGKYPVYVIEATPSDGSDSDYSKVLLYVRQGDFIPLKTRFYKGGKEVKTIFVEKLDETDAGKTYVKQMTLRPSDGGYTRMKLEAFDDAELPDSVFARERLGK